MLSLFLWEGVKSPCDLTASPPIPLPLYGAGNNITNRTFTFLCGN